MSGRVKAAELHVDYACLLSLQFRRHRTPNGMPSVTNDHNVSQLDVRVFGRWPSVISVHFQISAANTEECLGAASPGAEVLALAVLLKHLEQANRVPETRFGRVALRSRS